MFSRIRTIFGAIGITLLIFQAAQAATITVTSREDSGPGTLREALSLASDGDTINFSLGGNSITVYSQLHVTDDITIDGGFSQVIGSNGTIVAASILFLDFNSVGSTIQNLSLIDAYRGLDIYNGADNVQVLGCAIGTDWSDTDGVGNTQGIRIQSSSNVAIGAIGQGNVISGNDDYGIYINGGNSVTVYANSIGVNSTKDAALTGQDEGILVATGSYITIGGDVWSGRANVISGNTLRGIAIGSNPPNTTGIDIAGNIIGMNVSRTAAIPNGIGVALFQFSTDVEVGQAIANHMNLIAGNSSFGLYLDTCSGNVIRNNLIGVTDANLPFGNGSNAIALSSASNNEIGGRINPVHLESNLISGNSGSGIFFTGSSNGNTVSGNFIGTDLTGNTPIANSYGIRIDGGTGNIIGGGGATSLTARGNVISGNSNEGFRILGGSYNAILGNVIGLAVDGVTALPNFAGMNITAGSDYTIGTAQPGEGNVISGHGQDGIYMSDVTRFRLSGNLFGTSVDGLTQVPNALRALYMGNCDDCWVGGLAPGAGNLFTDSHYLSADSDNNTIVGNGYGVLLDGSPLGSPIGTALTIGSNSDSNWIGLPNGGLSNYIADAGVGIAMTGSPIYNGVFGNTVVGSTNPFVFQPGANQDKSQPALTTAYPTLVSGTSDPGDYIEVFKADRAAGFMGGASGMIGYTTADGSGNWAAIVSGIIAGEAVTAIATDASNNSSKFAWNILVTDPPTATPTTTYSATPTRTITPTPSSTGTITPTPTVSATASPTATISATATVSPTISVTTTVTPTVTASPTTTATPTSTPTTSLGGVNLDGKFALAYPNPASNQVTFLFHLEQAAVVKLVIFNFAGEQVASLEQNLPVGQGQTLVWDTTDVAPGLYLVRILKDGNLVETQKVAIVK